MQELATSLQTDAGMVVPPGFTCMRTNGGRLYIAKQQRERLHAAAGEAQMCIYHITSERLH